MRRAGWGPTKKDTQQEGDLSSCFLLEQRSRIQYQEEVFCDFSWTSVHHVWAVETWAQQHKREREDGIHVRVRQPCFYFPEEEVIISLGLKDRGQSNEKCSCIFIMHICIWLTRVPKVSLGHDNDKFRSTSGSQTYVMQFPDAMEQHFLSVRFNPDNKTQIIFR